MPSFMIIDSALNRSPIKVRMCHYKGLLNLGIPLGHVVLIEMKYTQINVFILKLINSNKQVL